MRGRRRRRGDGKVVALVILGVVVVGIAGALVYYLVGQQMPEDVVREFIAAEQEGSQERMRACLTDDSAAAANYGLAPLNLVGSIPDATVQETTVGDASFTKETAVVPVTVTLTGSITQVGIDELILEYQLVKVDGKWRIELDKTRPLLKNMPLVGGGMGIPGM